MRINNYNNLSYKFTTFGYNHKLDKKLENKLKEEPDTDDYIPYTIRDLKTFCNSTENILNIYQKAGLYEKCARLTPVFINSKGSLTGLVEEKYPELNYAEKELKSYKKDLSENKNIENPWQELIVEYLKTYLGCETGLNNNNKITDEAEAKADSNQNTENTQETEAQPLSAILKSSGLEFLEEFIPTESSPKNFDSLAGMEKLKDELYDKIITPVLHPEEAALDFEEYGKRPPRGILLYGPPGCGKTSIVEALSQEAELPLFKLKISKAGSEYINKTSRNYEQAFNCIAEYAEMIDAPCFLFIDEIDGFTKGRGKKSTTEELKQMGTLLNLIETARDRNIIVIGATNKYDIVDDAIKRRFDSQIYMSMPDIKTREQIFEKTLSSRTKGVNLANDKEALKELAKMSEGFPSSALIIITDRASDIARKDGRRNIQKKDILEEIKNNDNLKIKEENYQRSEEVRNKKRVGFL